MLFCDLPCSVNLWIRYVDDVLAIIPTEHNGTLLTHLNSLNEYIQFTYEKETHSSLPYLDLLINHKEDMAPYDSVCIGNQQILANTYRLLQLPSTFTETPTIVNVYR